MTRVPRSCFLLLGLLLILPGMVLGADLRLSLQEAQRMALEQNPMISAAQAEVSRVKAGRLGAMAGILPSIGVYETYSRTNDAVNAFGFKLKQERFTQADFAVPSLNQPAALTNANTRLVVRQPIFGGGDSIFRRNQASAGVRAAEKMSERRSGEIAFATAQAYYGLILAAEELKVVRKALTSAESHVATAEAHFTQEMVPLSDVLAARVRLADLREKEIEADNGVAITQEGLRTAIGTDADATFVPTDSLRESAVTVDPEALIAEALRSRPDLTAQAHLVAAARCGAAAERARYVPRLDFVVVSELDAQRPFRRQGESWTANLMLSWEALSFGTVAAERSARAERAKAEAMQRHATQQARLEVRESALNLRAAHERIGVARQAVEEARERLRMVELQYGQEMSTMTDLLAAEAAFTESQGRLLRALHGFRVGLARLELAIGK
jgi:outer membrane protein TolC